MHARQQQRQLLGEDERGLHQRGRILALQAIPGQHMVAHHDLRGVWPARSPRILACMLFTWILGLGLGVQDSGSRVYVMTASPLMHPSAQHSG